MLCTVVVVVFVVVWVRRRYRPRRCCAGLPPGLPYRFSFPFLISLLYYRSSGNDIIPCRVMA